MNEKIISLKNGHEMYEKSLLQRFESLKKFLLRKELINSSSISAIKSKPINHNLLSDCDMCFLLLENKEHEFSNPDVREYFGRAHYLFEIIEIPLRIEGVDIFDSVKFLKVNMS